MEEMNILLERFYSTQMSGKDAYFDVDEIIELINYFLENEDLSHLNDAINLGYKLHPDDTDFSLTICQSLMAMNDFKSAQKVLDGITVKDNEDVDLCRIECLLGLNRYNEAMTLVDELVNANVPYLEYILEGVACMLNEMEGMQDQALDFIKKAMALKPDNFGLQIEYCFNHELRGETKKALELCQKLVDKEPFSSDAWYMFGRLHSLCLNIDKAIEAFDFAIAAEQEDHKMLYEIKCLKAYCLLKSGNYEEAISCYEELIMTEQIDILDINPFMAKCYMKIEDYDTAFQLLEPVVGNENLLDEVAVTGDMIYCAIETERREYALELFCEALKRYPHSILDYLSTLNMFRNDEMGTPAPMNPAYPEELTRMFRSSNIYCN
jgi:tetratricopeptide (TPR) repeat protein